MWRLMAEPNTSEVFGSFAQREQYSWTAATRLGARFDNRDSLWNAGKDEEYSALFFDNSRAEGQPI